MALSILSTHDADPPREPALKRLGFVSYDEYLRSMLYQGIARRIKKRDAYRCCLCSGTAVDVHHHHYGYDALAGRDDAALVSICRRCHIHIEHRGSKRLSWYDTRKRFRTAMLAVGRNKSEFIRLRDEHVQEVLAIHKGAA